MGNQARQQTIYQQIGNTFSTAKKYLGTTLLPFLAILATLLLAATPVWAATLNLPYREPN